ncbi:unnamed protein product [Acanthoscelides obtectus]|nr:unnamed protein product [Acanthoscelides obtectus]CAK1672925.1 Aftiphilin [Acanthoscelides obtectus]
MSNIIPPLLCNTPPPPPSPDEEDEDDFGDFSGANDYSYGCDNLSLPSTPEESPKKVIITKQVDINCNAENKKEDQTTVEHVQKNYLDRRKSNESFDSGKLKYSNHVMDKIDSCNDISQNVSVDVSEGTISDNTNQISPLGNENEINIEKCHENDPQPEQIEDLPLDELSFDNCGHDDAEFMREITDFSDVYRAIEQSGYSDNQNNEDEFGDFVVNAGIEINKPELNNDDNIIYITSSFTKESEIGVGEEKNHSAIASNSEDAYIQYNHMFESKSSLKDDDPNSESDSLKENDKDIIFDNDFVENSLNSAVTPELKLEGSTSIISDNQELSEEVQEDDDFGNFETADPNSDSKTDNDFGDFANFASHEDAFKEAQTAASTTEQADDDFGDFTSSNSDDFFGASTSHNLEKPCIKYFYLGKEEAYQKAKEILKEMIPLSEVTGEDIDVKELGAEDFVFNQLKDVTETPALNYQWSKSSSQKMLLKALNIDARNILYGPSWNPTMPRFAANLTMEPLEPIKTECASPSLHKSAPLLNPQPPVPEVPSAQFDWSGSGLTNPLDPISATKTEDLTVETTKQPDISTRIQDDSPTDAQHDNFEDFTSYQSTPMPQVSDTWSKQVPLRETYISSSDNHEVVPEVPLNVEAWLQPTIVTPELPRKQIDAEEDVIVEKEEPGKGFMDLEECDVSNEVREDAVATSVLSKAELSIFDSLSKSEDIITTSNESSPERVRGKVPENLQEPIASLSNEEDEFTDFQFSVPVSEISQPPRSLTPIVEPLKPVFEPSKPTVGLLKPVLEPLKPVPIASNVSSKAVPTQINWPDPGITEEELKKFDEVFSQPALQNQPEPTKLIQPEIIKSVQPDSIRSLHPEVVKQTQPNITKSGSTEIVRPMQSDVMKPRHPEATDTIQREVSRSVLPEVIRPVHAEIMKPLQQTVMKPRYPEVTKPMQPDVMKAVQLGNVKPQKQSNSFDDDEWTDFMSVQKPSPVHKMKTSSREQTSSPDLTLSVFNLGNIQPSRPPVPVITPTGLVQTKLSSNLNQVPMSPKSTPKNNVVIPQSAYHAPLPSIISHQFASQAYSFRNIGQPTNQNAAEDDEWGDFVSAQTVANGWPSTNHSSQQNQFNNHNVQQSQFKMVTPQVKSSVSNLVLPELDFVAPKGRTYNSRNK